jgi:hypothetical protein
MSPPKIAAFTCRDWTETKNLPGSPVFGLRSEIRTPSTLNASTNQLDSDTRCATTVTPNGTSGA